LAAQRSNRSTAAPSSAAPFVPATRSLPSLREAARGCRGCPLYANATQTVFGEGPATARVVIVGEQPGDGEDLAGRPFVGPAGQLLDEALIAAGVPRDAVYVTNAVKHFKFTVKERPKRGKQRIHARPSTGEIRACRPWLLAELETLTPDVLVLLGATAAQSLLGLSFKVTAERGKPRPSEWAAQTIATVHPASILRLPDAELRKQARLDFQRDIDLVGKLYRAASHD
jgi:uracil-DNA glycosylase